MRGVTYRPPNLLQDAGDPPTAQSPEILQIPTDFSISLRMYALSASTVALHFRMSRLSTTTCGAVHQVTRSSRLPTPRCQHLPLCAKLPALCGCRTAWHTRPDPAVS